METWVDEFGNPTVAHTAYHEAAHAVVQAVLGILRNDAVVTICSNRKGEYGYVTVPKHAHDFERRSKRYIRALILSEYAGPAATKKLQPKIDLIAEGSEYESDVIFAEYLMRFCAPLGCDDFVFAAFKDRMWKKSQSLVAKHWAEIRAVGKLLLKRRTLSGKEVRAAITPQKPKRQSG